MTSDLRIRSDEKPNRAILLTWLAVSALITLVAWPRISHGRLPDPDDFLRLVQVRDLIAGQGWYDLHQYRITPPDGVLMHWSRLVDGPLYLSIQLLEPLLGQALAEQVTIFCIPLILFGLICLVVGRLAWRLFDVETAVFACLVLGMWPHVVQQVQPMRIDHHAYQILMIAIAAWALSWRSGLRGGAAAGAAMGIGAMISLETLPLAAGFGFVLLLRWLRDHQLRWWLVGYMKGFALTLALVFAATRGLPDLAEHCDAISPAHIGFFVITALATTAIATVPRLPRVATLGLFAAAGIGGVAFFGLSAPECLSTPFGELDPMLRENWYLNVREGLPIWHQTFDVALPTLAQGLAALGAAFAIHMRERDWMRQWWLEYALLLVVAILAGITTFRSFAFVGVLGAIPLAWLARQLLLRFRSAQTVMAKLFGAALLYLVLVPSTPFVLAKRLAVEDQGSAGLVGTRDSSCDPVNAIPLLDSLPASRLFAPLDLGPAVLLTTHHSVIASGHHRAQQAMRDVIQGFASVPERSRAIIDRYGADYVAVCMDMYEADNYSRLGGSASLMARLTSGNPPAWLEPVDVGGPETLRVWKVRRGGTPSPAH